MFTDFFALLQRPAWPGPHNPSGQKAIDTANREKTDIRLVPNNRGPGLSAPYGMFIELAHTKYGVNRFFKTAPAVAFPLRPTMKGVHAQVNNPATQMLAPGFVENLQVGETDLSAMVNKRYIARGT